MRVNIAWHGSNLWTKRESSIINHTLLTLHSNIIHYLYEDTIQLPLNGCKHSVLSLGLSLMALEYGHYCCDRVLWFKGPLLNHLLRQTRTGHYGVIYFIQTFIPLGLIRHWSETNPQNKQVHVQPVDMRNKPATLVSDPAFNLWPPFNYTILHMNT